MTKRKWLNGEGKGRKKNECLKKNEMELGSKQKHANSISYDNETA